VSETDPSETGGAKAADPLGGEPVRDAFLAFEKVRRLGRLYDAGHRLLTVAVEDLTQLFARALDAHRILHIDVNPDDFTYDGQVVLPGGGRETSVPARLHRDGVRALTFRAGLGIEELSGLIDVLEGGAGDADGEDLTTLLWQQGFERIEYDAVDEAGVGEDGADRIGTASRPDELDARMDDIVVAILSARPSDVGASHGGIRVTVDREGLLELERRATVPEDSSDADLALLALPEETLAELAAEGRAEDGSALVDRALSVVFDMIGNGEASVDEAGLLALLTPFLRASLVRGDLALVGRIIGRAGERPATDSGGSLAGLPAELAAELGRRANLDLMLRASDADPADLRRLLSLLPSESLPDLALAVADVPEGPVATLTGEVILARVADAPEALLAYTTGLETDRAEELLLTALDRTETARLPEVVMAMLGHENEAVAARAIAMAPQFPTVERREVIERGLVDRRPAVRIAACRAIEVARETVLLDGLSGRLDAGSSTGAERTAVIHAIATLGGATAVDVLRRHLTPRRGLLGRRDSVERTATIAALRDVADPAIRGFLAEGTHSKDRRFAQACRAALGGGNG